MDLQDIIETVNPPEEQWNSKGYRKEIYLFDSLTRNISIYAKKGESESPTAVMTLRLTGRTKLKRTAVSFEITELKIFKTKIFDDGTPMIGAWLAADTKYTPPLTEPFISVNTVLPREDMLLLEDTWSQSKSRQIRAHCIIRKDPTKEETEGFIEQLSFDVVHVNI
jgi:hypothetical protein